jgi:hypothetical protein
MSSNPVAAILSRAKCIGRSLMLVLACSALPTSSGAQSQAEVDRLEWFRGSGGAAND